MTTSEFEATHHMPDYYFFGMIRQPDGSYGMTNIFQLSQMVKFQGPASAAFSAELDRLFPDSKIDNEDFGLPPNQT